MGRFAGFMAVQVEVLVPKQMPKEIFAKYVAEIRKQAVTVLNKGGEHIARANAADNSEFDRVVITLVPTTPNDSWAQVAREINALPKTEKPGDLCADCQAKLGTDAMRFDGKDRCPTCHEKALPKIDTTAHLSTCARAESPVTEEACRGCGAKL